MIRQVALVLFPGFHLLDAAGPIAVFDLIRRSEPHAYDIRLLSVTGGAIRSTAGITFETAPLATGPFDTIMVAGGEIADDYHTTGLLVEWLQREAPGARRTTSVSTGAFLLAEAGLLHGRRATTHWGATQLFARRFPTVSLDADRIFIRDDSIWTSAGATAGIDLTLALVEDDLGAEAARRIAQLLVVDHRRPGGQSQHSALLELAGMNGRFSDLMCWVRDHLAEPMSVEQLAEQAAMSPRHFARTFTREVGITPAKAVEKLRVEEARTRIEDARLSVDAVARDCGFGDPERMRRAFLRHFGLPPQMFRRPGPAR
ncbi:AraC family transcriptional regulator [Novosphingobium barchaimii LL02]|uniref:AraC family transcriptional regulator n=1 Tax=Novosphingobium barchaimii LL02 TaxID=1114963 RepID=A0A0J7XIT9_9SPHN|nr:GlxA family transcriptional regulator [Novosphingobium barchaimii]KMS51667.1 AraC family transcriptional regulator [Novosphingobium barchaimii LL02]